MSKFLEGKAGAEKESWPRKNEDGGSAGRQRGKQCDNEVHLEHREITKASKIVGISSYSLYYMIHLLEPKEG